MAADGPIFIGGLSKSGKTQLRLALSSHSRISMSRRTYMWTKYLDRFGDLGRPENLDRCLETMMQDPGVLQLQPDAAEIRRQFVTGESSYARLFGLVHQQHASRLGKPRWGDQLGMVEAYAAQIFDAFPSARMVHLVRDPRDLRSNDGQGSIRPGKLGWMTGRWLYSADLAVRNQQRYSGRYLVVRYEALAATPERTLLRVMRLLDEELEPGMVEPLLALRSTMQSQPRYSAAAAAFIERSTASRLDILDYRRTRKTPHRWLGLSFYAVDLPLNQIGMAAWKTVGVRSLTAHAGR